MAKPYHCSLNCSLGNCSLNAVYQVNIIFRLIKNYSSRDDRANHLVVICDYLHFMLQPYLNPIFAALNCSSVTHCQPCWPEA